ncbi:hypothetical protein [Sorangium sp. So ce1078]|uniref:hypothetical protein n=1 Tax=Sorangium sp. So ce1078 TaxID=3133329 RepID=UPI003F6071F0
MCSSSANTHPHRQATAVDLELVDRAPRGLHAHELPEQVVPARVVRVRRLRAERVEPLDRLAVRSGDERYRMASASEDGSARTMSGRRELPF